LVEFESAKPLITPWISDGGELQPTRRGQPQAASIKH
jgi:hypothetical protein